MRRLRKRFLASLCAALLSMNPVTARGQDAPAELLEHKIKAGLVYNFLKYTTWPAAAALEERGRLKVCLYGENPLGGYLSPLDGRTAQQFTISITRISRVGQASGCHALFISSSDDDLVSELINFIGDKPILTISGANDFVGAGGMVELSKKGEFIRIYINKAAIREAGLKVENRLLDLAETD